MTKEEKRKRRKERWNKYYSEHRDEYLEKKKQRRLQNLEHCKAIDKRARDKRKHKKRSYQQIWDFDRKLELKVETLDQYGGICAICGEAHLECLTIDHERNDGAEFRRKMAEKTGGDYIKRKRYYSGVKFYMWLKQNGFPKDLGLRVLCFNCNCSIGAYGYSPYE